RRAANGGWQDVTERAGVGVLDDTASALFLDLRNQGVQDLIVLTTSMPMLFLNDGRGRYRYGADAFRFARPPSGSFAGMAAADFDRDGKLDLYLCSYLYFQGEDQYRYPSPYHDAETGPPNFLFRNRLNADGSGSFEDVTAEAGLDQNNSRYSFAASWCDYDGDGWPDLYVANDFGRNNLYQNDGGKFRDVAREAGVEDLGPGMSAAWFDYDRDGRPDLYVANMWTPAGQRVAADPAFGPVKAGLDPKAYHGHTKGNSLFRNLGGGAFEYTAGREGVEMGRWAWSADGIDFDLDGTPEIYIASGMITHSPGKDLMSFFWRQVVAKSPAERKAAPDYENGWNCLNQLIREDWSWNGNEPNVFYVRKGDRFYDYSGVSGLDVAADSRAFAATDFDGDGALDLFVKNRLGPQILALRNRSWEGRKVIVLELEGKRSNRDGIGARVEVEHESGRVAQWLAAGSGYISQHTKRLHFGLDRSSVAHAVKVRWPSGLEQEFRGLAAGFRYRIVEGSSQLRRVPLSAPAPVSKPVAPVEPVNDLVVEPTWLLDPAPLPEERRGTGFLCLTSGDPGARPAGVPLEVLDLQKAPPETAAAYALLRRYLFDYRAPLRLPWLLLIDEQGQIHKVYPSIPDAAVLRRDLALMRGPDRTSLALPFAGQYYSRPGRNYLRLGSPFLEAGYPEQALFYLKAAIRREPGNFKAQLAVGQIHLEAGRYADARAHLEIAARLNPDSPELWNNFGGLEMAKEDYAAALRYFEKALSIRPDLHFVLANAGQAQARLGNTDAAEKMLLRALELEPTDADTANQLGLLLARRGEFDSAARLFQQAITHQRDHSAAINNLAVLYVRTRKMDDAAAALRYGIQVAPDSETFYFNLARLHADRGDLPRARQVIEELLARKPGHAGARKALAELEQR
ncbi:MAG: VCBS repeat-containing protein, partial [Acidobacteria bacterium]|nr:VCBS repeat-containing protein [Acidobacteriota bacterium]